MGLSSMAARCGIAVLVIRNEVKARNGPALGRGQGSIAIAAAARSVLAVVPHPGDPRLKALVSLKSNLGPKPPALVFRIVPAGDSSAAEWIEETELNADDLAGDLGAHALTAIGTAHKFLEAHLANGPISVKEVAEAAEAEGIASPTLRRARRELGVRSVRGRGDDRNWYLCLPDAGSPESEVPDDHQVDQEQMQVEVDQHDRLGAGPSPPTGLSPHADRQEQQLVSERRVDQGDQVDRDDHLDHGPEGAHGEGDAAAYKLVDPAPVRAKVPDVLSGGISESARLATSGRRHGRDVQPPTV
jgi:hypothetical protein